MQLMAAMSGAVTHLAFLTAVFACYHATAQCNNMSAGQEARTYETRRVALIVSVHPPKFSYAATFVRSAGAAGAAKETDLFFALSSEADRKSLRAVLGETAATATLFVVDWHSAKYPDYKMASKNFPSVKKLTALAQWYGSLPDRVPYRYALCLDAETLWARPAAGFAAAVAASAARATWYANDKNSERHSVQTIEMLRRCLDDATMDAVLQQLGGTKRPDEPPNVHWVDVPVYDLATLPSFLAFVQEAATLGQPARVFENELYIFWRVATHTGRVLPLADLTHRRLSFGSWLEEGNFEVAQAAGVLWMPAHFLSSSGCRVPPSVFLLFHADRRQMHMPCCVPTSQPAAAVAPYCVLLQQVESCAWDVNRERDLLRPKTILPFADKLASLPGALREAQMETRALSTYPVGSNMAWTLAQWAPADNKRRDYYQTIKPLLYGTSLFPGCRSCQRQLCPGSCEISHELQKHGIHNDSTTRRRPFLSHALRPAWIDQMMQHAETAIQENIPGAFMETGVWRGGMSIAMAAVAAAHCDTRPVFVCDSFKGIPAVSASKKKQEGGLVRFGNDNPRVALYLSVPRRFVQAAFRDFGLLSPAVHFVEGYFNETMPVTDPGAIAILRLDGDLYSSTMDVLTAQYPRLSPGGFVVIDDYVVWGPCRDAIHDYRKIMMITEPLVLGGNSFATYWRKSLMR